MNIKEVTRQGLENTHQDTLFNNAQFSIGFDILLSMGLVNFTGLVLNIMKFFSILANTKKAFETGKSFLKPSRGPDWGLPNPLALAVRRKTCLL